MKILHIGKYFHPAHGGIESFVLDLASASARQGVRQGVLVHAHPGASQSPAGQSCDRNDYPFLDYFDRVPTYGSFGYAPISPGFRGRLALALRQFQPQLLHLHLPNPSAFWALSLAQARRIPWIIHWHADAAGPEFERLVRWLYPLYRPFEQAVLAHAQCIIVTSPPYLQASRALKRWQAKCRVVPLGLDSERLQPREPVTISPDWDQGHSLRILAVGRLTPYKGLDRLIEAMADSPAQLVILGGGSQHARLAQLIGERGLQQRVHLMGGASDASRNSLLAQCDLVCQPSLNRAEAFGISVLEAMAAGKPALVSKLEGSGLSWLVQDGHTGWHVAPGDAAALAERIHWLAAHRPHITASGEHAAARYRAHFAIDRVAAQVIELQQTLVDAHRSQSAAPPRDQR